MSDIFERDNADIEQSGLPCPVNAEQIDPRAKSILDGVDFSIITPNDQAELIRLARMRGINLGATDAIQRSIQRFIDELHDRMGKNDPSRQLSATDRTLISCWESYCNWCKSNAIAPVLPATMNSILNYIEFRASSADEYPAVSTSTINSDIWAISRFHKEAGCPDPTKEPKVKSVVARIKRTLVLVEGQLVRQATGLCKPAMKILVDTWGNKSSNLKEKRDLAILVVAYSTLLRASELARIKLSDMEIGRDSSITITIPVTKSNHSGFPDLVHLVPSKAKYVLQYLNADGRAIISSGFLFGRVTANGRRSIKQRFEKPLTVQAIRNVFSTAWSLTRHTTSQTRQYTAHSARVGAAQDMRRKGTPLKDIMDAGRWTNITMAQRYTKIIDAKESKALSIQDDF